MKKVIGYIRVSTNHQDLDRQKALIRRYCEENGYILFRLIEDFGISGAEANRPGYIELQALTEESCDMIVVSELSRLSRDEDVMSTLNTIYALIAKFDLVMLDDLSITYQKGIRLDFIEFIRLAFKAYGAADERKKIAERMKTGKDSLLLRYPMACLGNTVPLGFKKVPHPDYKEKGKGIPKSILVEDPEEMSLVRQIFCWADEGMSVQKIAFKLQNIGILSQRGLEMSKTYVRFILHQPLYIGYRRQGKHGSEITYPTGEVFVDPDLWNRVQETLKENRTRADKYTKHLNPLKGILKCACGCNMQYVMQASGKGIQYACVSKKYKYDTRDTITACEFYGINANFLNDTLWYEVKYRILDKEYQAKSSDKIEALKLENLQLSQSISNKESEIEQKKDLQDQIIENIATSTNAKVVEVLNKKVDALDTEISGISTIINNIRKEIAKNEKRIKEELKSQSIKELQEMTLEGKAQIFREMFEKVEYVSNISRTGYIVVSYKNGIQTIYLYRYKNNRDRAIINLPTSFRYNPATHKVAVTYIGEKGKKFSLQKTVIEYDPEEMIRSFNFKGDPEHDISNVIFD